MSDLTVQFIQSEHWNTGYEGPIGGTGIGTLPIGEALGDVFVITGSDFIGRPDRFRFQKIFIENTGDQDLHLIISPVIFWNNLKFPEQLSLSFEYTGGSTGDTPTGYPEGYVDSDFFTPLGLVNASGIPITGLDTGEEVGIWLRQKITSNLPAETGAHFEMIIGGDTGA